MTGGESIRVVAPSHTGRMDMAKGEGEDATNARPLVPSNEQPSDIMRPCSASAVHGWHARRGGLHRRRIDMLSSRKGMPALAHER